MAILEEKKDTWIHGVVYKIVFEVVYFGGTMS